MSTATHVSIAEYLQTDYEPECELIAGELIAKPMGTLDHMNMERRLARLLERYEQESLGQVVWELSFRKGNDVRIPDVVFLQKGARFENGILMDPPMLAIEVLSPSQRQSELFAKCEVYHAWGVPYCWVIDPAKNSAWEYHQGGPVRLIAGERALSAGEIKIALDEVFG